MHERFSPPETQVESPSLEEDFVKISKEAAKAWDALDINGLDETRAAEVYSSAETIQRDAQEIRDTQLNAVSEIQSLMITAFEDRIQNPETLMRIQNLPDEDEALKYAILDTAFFEITTPKNYPMFDVSDAAIRTALLTSLDKKTLKQLKEKIQPKMVAAKKAELEGSRKFWLHNKARAIIQDKALEEPGKILEQVGNPYPAGHSYLDSYKLLVSLEIASEYEGDVENLLKTAWELDSEEAYEKLGGIFKDKIDILELALEFEVADKLDVQTKARAMHERVEKYLLENYGPTYKDASTGQNGRDLERLEDILAEF